LAEPELTRDSASRLGLDNIITAKAASVDHAWKYCLAPLSTGYMPLMIMSYRKEIVNW
jgi:hypothetical protein